MFEGFGIPILKAFHTGTPVITSRAGGCEEVAGGAALLVDELDPAAIANILADPALCYVSGDWPQASRRIFLDESPEPDLECL